MTGKCINHTFKCRGIGYGYLQHEGKQVLAHRLAYCQANDLPLEDIAGQVVRHKCDNPKCVNPDHLEIGSQADNMTDKVQRGRALRGEHIGNSKTYPGSGERNKAPLQEAVKGIQPVPVSQKIRR